MPDMAFDFSIFPEEQKSAWQKDMPFDFSAFPEEQNPATPKEMPFDFSIFPEKPKPETFPYAGGNLGSQLSSYYPDHWINDKIPAAPSQPLFTSVPRQPEQLYRENAQQILQDIWNAASPEPTVGPLREHPLRPDVRQPLWTLFKKQALPNEPTGIVENMEAGLRQASAHVAANVISLIGAPMDVSGGPTREEQYNSVYKAIYKTILPDNLASPQDFTDSLARGVGEAAPNLVEAMLLSYATGGVLNPLFEGMAAKFPTLAARLLPIARDALSFGAQGALEPEQPGRQAAIGTGVGAILGTLSPYSRLARIIGGASVGAGQEYLTNPNATVNDYARSATLMGAFVGLAATHGVTVEETIGGTLFDWAKTKGYTPEEIRRALQTQGIRPVLNEFAEDMTAPPMENRSGAVVGTRPGEQIGTIEHPIETIPDPNKTEHGRFISNAQKPMVGERQGEYAQLTEMPEFKNWFGDSKAVFKEGESDYFQNPEGIPGIPRMVYYGTPERHSSDLFRPDERGVILFTTSQDAALQIAGKEGEVIPVYLKIENPLAIKSTGANLIGDAVIDKAKAQGNDGVILDCLYGNYTYAVFSPDQVKSPLNRGIFEQNDSDILNKTDRSNVEYTTVGKIFHPIEEKPVEIIGLQMTDRDSLASLAQVWRNPNYEELHYVYIRDGIIVDHEGVTCRLPMMSHAFLGDPVEGIRHIRERIAALGADSLYLVHNHGSGNLEPSGEDLHLTVTIARDVPEMKGHIIINSGKYIFIDLKGEYKPYLLPGLPEKWIDPILTASVPHEMLDAHFKSPEEIAAWSKALTAERNKPIIVYLSPGFTVRGLQEINPGGTLDWRQLAEIMPKKLVDFGSAHAVLILPERSRGYMLEIGESLVRQGVFYDVVSVDEGGPHSVLELGTHVEKKRFGGRPFSDFPAQSIR